MILSCSVGCDLCYNIVLYHSVGYTIAIIHNLTFITSDKLMSHVIIINVIIYHVVAMIMNTLYNNNALIYIFFRNFDNQF